MVSSSVTYGLRRGRHEGVRVVGEPGAPVGAIRVTGVSPRLRDRGGALTPDGAEVAQLLFGAGAVGR